MVRKKPRKRAWRVYMLRCADGSLYTGCTNDLARRVAAHQAGKGARYTRARRPVVLVWSARVKDRGAALRREFRLKQLTRGEKLALMGGPRLRRSRAREGPPAPRPALPDGARPRRGPRGR